MSRLGAACTVLRWLERGRQGSCKHTPLRPRAFPCGLWSAGHLRRSGALALAPVSQENVLARQRQPPRLELPLGHVHARAQHCGDEELRRRRAHTGVIVLQNIHLHSYRWLCVGCSNNSCLQRSLDSRRLASGLSQVNVRPQLSTHSLATHARS